MATIHNSATEQSVTQATIHDGMPSERPNCPNFSCGPCTKRSGWTVEALKDAPVGRSHRSKIGKEKLAQAIDLTRAVLNVPDEYLIGIVPASDTGAVEMALWSLLGERGLDIAAWESFSANWVEDVVEQLKLSDVRVFTAPYGALPDLGQLDFHRDVVFAWNGTTSGVRVPNADFIPDQREGLVICDATSAIFGQNLDLSKLDVITYSWQKVLGGEAAHGILILSPRAVERLERWQPSWPLPKIFRLTRNGKLIRGIFSGDTINTPSMICVEDYLGALKWVQSLGGVEALMARTDRNFAIVDDFLERSVWLKNLVQDPAIRSNTSVCMEIVDPEIQALDKQKQANFAKAIVARLESMGVAFDIGSYPEAPPGLRIWTGATIEAEDLRILTQWLDWAFLVEKAALEKH